MLVVSDVLVRPLPQHPGSDHRLVRLTAQVQHKQCQALQAMTVPMLHRMTWAGSSLALPGELSISLSLLSSWGWPLWTRPPDILPTMWARADRGLGFSPLFLCSILTIWYNLAKDPVSWPQLLVESFPTDTLGFCQAIPSQSLFILEVVTFPKCLSSGTDSLNAATTLQTASSFAYSITLCFTISLPGGPLIQTYLSPTYP